MTIAVIKSRALAGMQAPEVSVEVHLANGLPAFTIVGLADTEVKESRDRVRAAITNAGFKLPEHRITVNLAPGRPAKATSQRFQVLRYYEVLYSTFRPGPMNSKEISVLRLSLFKDSHPSFIAALDQANIRHERVHLFSSGIQASGIVETISALSDAMPWNSLAKVIVAWLDARKSRKVIIQTEDGRIIHAEGYSANEIQKFLPVTVNVTIIETNSADKP